MVTTLRWQYGFGWLSILFSCAFFISALRFDGIGRWLSVAACLFVLGYMLTQHRHWKRSPWRQIHHRAMYAYAGFAGMESASAKNEGREFSRVNACICLQLALDPGSGLDAIQHVSAIADQGGSYLARVFEKRAQEVLPKLKPDQLSKLSEILSRVEFGPMFIIANKVERTYGGVEASRYIWAILNKEAT
jgi:hypothetical protein